MKIKILSHNFTGKSLVVVSTIGKGVQTKIVDESHPNWKLVLALYKQGRYDELVPALDIGGAINALFKGRFRVVGTDVFYDGKPVGGYLIERMLFFMRELPKQSERLIKFAEKLYRNPDPRVIDQLYKFLEHKGMTLTDDGDFLAYKGIGANYYSHTSGDIKVLKGKVKDGKIWNGVGAHVIVARPQVCSDPNIGCSSGLHVGSWEYANDFKGDGHMMVVKVNPEKVCSVPTDCSWQKCRACEYEVIAEEGRKLHEVKDSNFDKVAKVRLHRDSLGRFSKFCRDNNGRFASKQ
jgi:hypothetical protein